MKKAKTKDRPWYDFPMLRGHEFASGETYHVFNRGAHKQTVFISDHDCKRFQCLLYFANRIEAVDMGNLIAKHKGRPVLGILEQYEELKQDERLVDLFAYALMPNHFHIVLRQRADKGISTFMRKVATAYAMYFNTKYEHSGVLFQGRFKSSHIANEPYFRYIFAYVHLNPVELVEPGWKEEGIEKPTVVREFLRNYRFSSYVDYSVGIRTESKMLALSEAPSFFRNQNDLEDLLQWETLPRTVLGKDFQ